MDKNFYKDRKIALVTGANSGMGKETVIELAKQDFHVVMLCRSRDRGMEALREISGRRMQKGSVDLLLADLGDMKSIQNFCQEFHQRYPHLDVLINNAGVITLDRRETADGLELQFGVNHIGHFLLTLELLPLMRLGSRIVVVGSGAHKAGNIDFDNLDLKKGYNVVTAYSRAKLCNLLFTRELAERLKPAGITVNCVHPGAVATSMGVDRDTGFGKTVTGLLKPIFQTPAEGAATAIYVATSPKCANRTGQYYYRKKIAKSSPKSKSRKLAQKLWEVSEKITGVSFTVE